MGNPSNAKADAETSPDNFLVARKQFVLSYNNSQKIPNWVSWHLNKDWIGTTGRTGVFCPDDQLPDSWYHVTPGDYWSATVELQVVIGSVLLKRATTASGEPP